MAIAKPQDKTDDRLTKKCLALANTTVFGALSADTLLRIARTAE
jgi:hypothetical protein